MALSASPFGSESTRPPVLAFAWRMQDGSRKSWSLEPLNPAGTGAMPRSWPAATGLGTSYRHRPNIGTTLAGRQSGASEAVKAIAWRAQHRLHARYRALLAKGKNKQKVITAVGRELLGFI
jgi:hypothetical protein